MKKKCINCGKIFYKKPSDSKRYWLKKKYCCIKCSGTLFNKTGRNDICAVCGNKLWIIPYKDKCSKTGKHFCSRECANKLVGKLKTGYHHTEETKQKIREARAKQIISKESYIKRGKKFSGKNHWNWKGGISNNPEVTYGNDWHSIRIKIYKRDNYICQKCGIKCSGKMGKNLIQCHHKQPWREGKNNNMKNLITLCLSCHIKEDFRYDRKIRDIKKSGGY